VVALVLLSATGCRADGTGPGYSVLAGTYSLTSVSGRGPSSGLLVLSSSGQAERRVRFASGSTSPEYVARGSYRLREDGSIELQLREDDGRSEYVWRPAARRIGRAVEIRHPDPGDGADIIETYTPL
jgi:hypothetical protein